MVANLVYGELSIYRSAFQGSAAPSSATGAIHGVAPYWRLALQKEWEHQLPDGWDLRPARQPLPRCAERSAGHLFRCGRRCPVRVEGGHRQCGGSGAHIHEDQTLDATAPRGGSANVKNTLKVLRLNASYYPRQWLGVSGGYFDTQGIDRRRALRARPGGRQRERQPQDQRFRRGSGSESVGEHPARAAVHRLLQLQRREDGLRWVRSETRRAMTRSIRVRLAGVLISGPALRSVARSRACHVQARGICGPTSSDANARRHLRHRWLVTLGAPSSYPRAPTRDGQPARPARRARGTREKPSGRSDASAARDP